ncbi:MAG: hypothetical protein M1837_003162, partial [Sclerophora amabilis]
MFTPRQIKTKTTDRGPANKRGLLVETEGRECSAKRLRLQTSQDCASRSSLTHATTKPAPAVDPSYNEEIVYGLELLLSDYNAQHGENAEWLRERQRTLEGEDGHVHLSSFLTHHIFSKTKPALTQKAIQNAVKAQSSNIIELHSSGYYIRRRTSSTSIIAPERIDWEAQTIYVEPHLSTLSANTPKLLHHLYKHSLGLLSTLLPVQNVSSRNPAWAFITFSGGVDDALAMRKDIWPAGWIVMT